MCLINLSLGTGVRDFNISLLSSSLGAFLPGPSFPIFREKVDNYSEYIDSVDTSSDQKKI